jgi:disease resistance protein RPM1
LPLAIVTIGNLLSSKVWKELLDRDNIQEILNSIYNDLSGDLKSCFLYCCLFPENYIIPCESLIRLWVAEGFVRDSADNTAEEMAEKILFS